jgi:hypothetical protein
LGEQTAFPRGRDAGRSRLARGRFGRSLMLLLMLLSGYSSSSRGEAANESSGPLDRVGGFVSCARRRQGGRCGWRRSARSARGARAREEARPLQRGHRGRAWRSCRARRWRRRDTRWFEPCRPFELVTGGDDPFGIRHDPTVVEKQIDVVLRGEERARVPLQHEVGPHGPLDRLHQFRVGGVDHTAEPAAEVIAARAGGRSGGLAADVLVLRHERGRGERGSLWHRRSRTRSPSSNATTALRLNCRRRHAQHQTDAFSLAGRRPDDQGEP